MNLLSAPSPNFRERRPGVRVDTVLLHHTASGPHDNSVAWLCDPHAGLSAHYVVDRDGKVYALVPEEKRALHAGICRFPWESEPGYDFNHRSVGIEIANRGDGKEAFTEAQYAALAELVPDILRRLEVSDVHVFGGGREQRTQLLPDARTPVLATVIGHRDVAWDNEKRCYGRKTDPADNFDWGRVRAALAGGRNA